MQCVRCVKILVLILRNRSLPDVLIQIFFKPCLKFVTDTRDLCCHCCLEDAKQTREEEWRAKKFVTEVSLQSIPSLDGLAHFDDAKYKPHNVMVKIKPAVIVWLSALHNLFVCLFRFCLTEKEITGKTECWHGNKMRFSSADCIKIYIV